MVAPIAAPITWAEDFQEFLAPYFYGWQSALCSLAFWGIVHMVSSFCFEKLTDWPQKAGEGLKSSDEKKGKKLKELSWYQQRAQFEMSVKMTAFIHAVLSSTASLYAIARAEKWILSVDNLYVVDELQRSILYFSAGYFLYDFVVAIIDFDIPFLIHGGMSSIIYIHAAARGFCLQLGCFFLLYEFSTIFLNIRALMIASRNASHPIFPYIEKLFFFTFMFFRMIVGLAYSLFVTIPALIQLMISGIPHSYIASTVLILANLAINALNVMWSKAMISILMGRGKRDQKPTGSVKDHQ